MSTHARYRLLTSGVALLIALALPLETLAEPPREHERREVLDERYHHDHYYPRVGAAVRELPAGYRAIWFHGERWFFHEGVWYVPGPGGFVVASPPIGLRIPALPPFYTTVWLGGVPYYYANGTYYHWVAADGSYEVVAAPPESDLPGFPPARAPDDFYLYPRNGQGPEQVAADRYECHNWARSESGFDPTVPPAAGSVSDANPGAERYRRAIMACLEGRGYSVR